MKRIIFVALAATVVIALAVVVSHPSETGYALGSAVGWLQNHV
jgi:hypothetical protein